MRASNAKSQGLTLVEVVLVLVLLGLVSMIVLSRLSPLTVTSSSLEEARLEMVARIVHARNRALLLDGAVEPTLTFRDKGFVYREQKASPFLTLPGASVVSSVPTLSFDAEGKPSDEAVITLETPDAKLVLRLEKSGYVKELRNDATRR